MIEAKVIEDRRGIYVEVDTGIYPEAVIDKVLYWYSSDYMICRRRFDNGPVEGISLILKQDTRIDNWKPVIYVFSDKLIDYKNRMLILDETKNLRELFFAKAFANSDDFVEFDFKD